MNRKLKKQIKAYTGFAGSLLASSYSDAQVIYTDIVPDDTTSFLLFDMNQDSQIDFIFYQTHFTYTLGTSSSVWAFVHNNFLLIYGYSNKKVLKGNYSYGACGFAYNIPNAFLFDQPDSIPSVSQLNNFKSKIKLENWKIEEYASTGFWGQQLCFFAADSLNKDFCIGVKLMQSGQPYYGWIRIRLLDKQLILKDYAYQSQPNIPILACDTTNLATSITDYNPQFNFSQQNNLIYISTSKNLNHAMISVYDLLGKEILQQPFEGKEATIKIDKKGIYFVEVKSEKGVFRKKVFIY
ncbi:MAG TPA: T9SS type A sorting domain-containing protein [Bacteroidia bacterium]|nr:T9SS type A sorting domain-containing protein [Bacteroidia bacterium]